MSDISPNPDRLLLQNMPNPVFDHITKHLNFMDVVYLRKLGRNMRNYLNNNTVVLGLVFVRIRVQEEVLFAEWDQFVNMTTEYSRHLDGCIVRQRGVFKFFPGEHFVDMFLRDWKLNVVNNKMTIAELKISFENLDSDHPIFEKLPALLSAGKHTTRVRKLEMVINEPDDALTVLPFIQPGYLTTINLKKFGRRGGRIVYTEENLEKLGNLPQWKLAAQSAFDLKVPTSASVAQYFTNFWYVGLNVEDTFSKDLIKIKEIIVNPDANLRSVFLINDERFQNIDEFIDQLGPEHVNNYASEWYFKIPKSSDVLQIKINHSDLAMKLVDRWPGEITPAIMF